MNGKERGSAPDLGSDLVKVDAHVVGPADYQDSPELDDAFFAGAALHEGGILAGTAQGASKQEVTLAIDRDVLDRFHAVGAD